MPRPCVPAIADRGSIPAVRRDPALAAGVDLVDGAVVSARVAEAQGLPAVELHDALS